MDKGSGEVERRGVSGERKAKIVGGFVGAVLIGVVIVLLLMIVYLAIRRERAVPAAPSQPKTQSHLGKGDAVQLYA